MVLIIEHTLFLIREEYNKFGQLQEIKQHFPIKMINNLVIVQVIIQTNVSLVPIFLTTKVHKDDDMTRVNLTVCRLILRKI